MPRFRPQVVTDRPFHVTARCLNREWFEIPLQAVWDIMEDYLFFIHVTYKIRIHSFVLMPNHFHLLLSSPHGNLSEAMNYFMRETSRQIGKEAGRINQVYGGRHHRCVIDSAHYFSHAYKYVYRNPAKAGLVGRVEDYRFSTLHGLLGQERQVIPLELDTHLFTPEFSIESLEWLNRLPAAQYEIDIGKALRRQIFQLPRLEKTKGPHPLELDLF